MATIVSPGFAESQPAALQAALRNITETLAAELARPTQPTLGWSETEWTLARAVAAMHGVSPLLAHLQPWPSPQGWTNFLRSQALHTAHRQARIERLLERIDHRMGDARVAVVALKGAALHAMGLYAGGERPMADVDLLVRPQAAECAAGVIESLGFFESGASWQERVFTPAGAPVSAALGEHSDNPIKIELHERIGEKLPWRAVDISACIFPLRMRPGLNDYPSRAALMLHLLLHAAGAMVLRSLRLLQLHDIALLAARMTPADWHEVLHLRPSGQRPWWAFPPLQLMSRYYSSVLVAEPLAALERECPSRLVRISRRRTLSDVSYSHLWVDPFPGIEWSGSTLEMLRYALGRIRPSAQHRKLREAESKAQAWASSSEWSTLSHSRRLVRFLASRQMRPVALHSVRSAFAEARR